MLKRFFTNKNLILYTTLFMIAFFVLAFSSQCSFIYPFNSWVDPNCYLTVAKAMTKGKVLYTDIFEQKGPYTYFLHVLCYFITPNSFLAVYFLEVVLAFISNCIIVKILKHYGINSVKKQIITCLFYSLIVYFSRAFAQGDSVEELINPILLASLYLTINKKNTSLTYFLIGVFAGIVLWVKYSLLGFFIGWYIYQLIFIIKNKNYKQIWYCLFVVLGVIVATLPPAIYFLAVDNVSTLLSAYILQNLKYQSEYNIFVKFGLCLWYIVQSIYENYTYTIPILLFIIITLIKYKVTYIKELLFIIICFISSAFLIFIGGRHYVYYGLPLNIYSIFFFVLIFKEDFKINKIKAFAIISSAIVSLSIVLTVFLSGHIYYMFRKKETLVQYQFSQIILQQENATILNYSFLDGGFYLFADYLPQNKYFCTLNNKLEEMQQEHEQMLLNKEVDFVIIRTDKLKELDLSKYDYHEVKRVSQRFHLATVFTYILYQKNP